MSYHVTPEHHAAGFVQRDFHGRGLGDLTMDPQTLAKLQACTDNCNKQYANDFVNLSLCFSSCNAQYPPTVQVPGLPPITPPSQPAPQPQPQPQPSQTWPLPIPWPSTPQQPQPQPQPQPQQTSTAKATSGDMTMWIIGGAIAVAAVGAVILLKK